MNDIRNIIIFLWSWFKMNTFIILGLDFLSLFLLIKILIKIETYEIRGSKLCK
ncbi:hypothetical protein AC1_A0281 [Clostridium perfringens B str. ATCC 3626]|uniref:Uncharacterized protein n=1 Tax=Clostridium perfringens B str. ATCC 3626 TaxID=451754 RepID=A0AAV3BLI7_CLOPF|nr:hypothetical protein AC1_A0281 [Clostridium perfringens B str. ATCC 3626]